MSVGLIESGDSKGNRWGAKIHVRVLTIFVVDMARGKRSPF